MGHPFRQSPGIHEDQAGSVLAHEVGHPVVDVAPNRICGYCAQLVLGNLDGQIHLATMTDIHDARHPLHSRSNGSPARCAPRLFGATAWISSTITVRTSCRILRLFSAVSSR